MNIYGVAPDCWPADEALPITAVSSCIWDTVNCTGKRSDAYDLDPEA
jgi:hypothetical protein